MMMVVVVMSVMVVHFLCIAIYEVNHFVWGESSLVSVFLVLFFFWGWFCGAE